MGHFQHPSACVDNQEEDSMGCRHHVLFFILRGQEKYESPHLVCDARSSLVSTWLANGEQSVLTRVFTESLFLQVLSFLLYI